MKIKVVVLDFDNCILLDEETRKGSEEAKDEAWFKIFSELSQTELEPVLEKSKKEIAGGKGDRKDVAERVIRHFRLAPLVMILSETELRCKNFNKAVQEAIIEIGVSKNIRTTLAQLKKTLPLYVNTATPATAALESLDALFITKYFKGVLGRPKTKVENLQYVVLAEKINPQELLFVDDQQSGYLAAQEIGCRFIGMHTARNTAWHNGGLTFPLIRSLSEIIKLV